MRKKVLVANRGEIAMRIFRTCRVMNIPTVAIYTHVDRGALHVRYAEEAYCISEDEADTSYLKPDLILEIAKKTGAAIHPGYGFLSENADFARRCEEEGVIFIGPSADVIAMFFFGHVMAELTGTGNHFLGLGHGGLLF